MVVPLMCLGHDDRVRAMMVPPAMIVEVTAPAMMEPVTVGVDDNRGAIVVPMAMMAVLVRGQNDRIGGGNGRNGDAEPQPAQEDGGFHEYSRELRCPSLRQHASRAFVPSLVIGRGNSRASRDHARGPLGVALSGAGRYSSNPPQVPFYQKHAVDAGCSTSFPASSALGPWLDHQEGIPAVSLRSAFGWPKGSASTRETRRACRLEAVVRTSPGPGGAAGAFSHLRATSMSAYDGAPMRSQSAEMTDKPATTQARFLVRSRLFKPTSRRLTSASMK